MRWRRGAIFGLSLVLAQGCGADSEAETPTQPPVGGVPGEGRLVGFLSVGYGVGYDLITGQFGTSDAEATAIGAGFISEDADLSGGGSAVPSAIPLPESGFALETCTYASTSQSSARQKVAADEGQSPLIAVGDSLTVTIDGVSKQVPLVTEEQLPAPFQGQPIPPMYLISSDTFDPELFVEGGTYDLSVPGSEALPGFEVRGAIEPPAPMVLQSPSLDPTPTLHTDADLQIEWQASTSSYVAIDLRASSGEGLTCVVSDDGSFVVPAQDLALLPEGEATLLVARGRLSYREVRLNEWFVSVAGAGVSGPVQLSPAGL